MRSVIFLIFLFIDFLSAKDIGVYEYTLDNEEYFTIGEVESKDKIKPNSVIVVKKQKEDTDESYIMVNEEFKKRNEEYYLLRIVQQDKYSELIEYLIKEKNKSGINDELSVVRAFKYPLHQAILNKSYRVISVLLDLENIKVDLKEDSGRTTADIFEINNYQDTDLGREILEKYKNTKYKTLKKGK